MIPSQQPGHQSQSTLTYGLNRDWKVATNLADKYNSLDSLHLLIDATLIHKKVSSLGSVLKAISSPVANQLLSNWAPIDPVAAGLYQLSSAVQLNQHIFDVYAHLTDQEAAARQLRGQLETHYLLALLLERIPPGNNTERTWYESMRTWVTLHALHRAQYGNCQDSLLREVATHLRLAADKMDQRLEVAISLNTPADDYCSLNGLISLKVEKLLDKKGLDSTVQAFLKCLKHVANGEHKQESDFKIPERLFNNDPIQRPAKTSENNKEGPLPWPLEGDDEQDELTAFPGSDDNTDTLGYDTDPEATYTLQRLSNNAVLLNAVEEAQLLPWSWRRPNPYETELLTFATESLVTSQHADDRLLGAYVWMALRTGRSLRRVLRFQISPLIDTEWVFDSHAKELKRSIPMRKNGWKPTRADELSWVRPVVDSNRIPVPECVNDILHKQISEHSTANHLWELWNSAWPNDPEKHFRERMKTKLPRLTPGMLCGVLPQRSYLETHDEVFALLVSAHPQSGLPAACAYANWTADQSAAQFIGLTIDTEIQPLPSIVMGSRLDPIEQLLASSVAEATQKFKDGDGGAGVVAMHNLATTYILMMLLAATGARPIRDPFESVLHFDFDEHFVYLDDKATQSERNARLVPLPVKLSRYIKEHYLAHLRMLARILQEANPRLASEIGLMAQGHPSGKMPFFFLLEDERGIEWSSVTGNALQSIGLLECPLPPNLFRQRLDKQLRRRGLQNEIIAGIFGHADAGSEIYGDYSIRTWAEDAPIARRVLTEAFEALPFAFLPIDIKAPGRIRAARQGQSTAPDLFGEAARERARRLFNLNAVRLASAEIEQFLIGQQLHQLSPENLDSLSRTMLFHDNGLPRANGAIRYEHLLRMLERSWEQHGKRIRISKRYVVPRPSSPFTQEAPRAATNLALARGAAEIAISTKPVSKLTLTDCAVLAPILLALECRIADVKTLIQVSTKEHFRIVSGNGAIHLELGKEDQLGAADASVTRRKISAYCAHVLARLRAGKPGPGLNKLPVPGFLAPVADAVLQATGHTAILQSGQLISSLAKIVDQHNAMKLPGVLAGYLGGRVKSTSLAWSDWLRLHHGYPVQLPKAFLDANDSQANASSLEEIVLQMDAPGAFRAGGDAPENAKEFFRKLRECLAYYRKPERNGQKSRQELTTRLDRELKDACATVNGASLMLGYWIRYLVTARLMRGKYYAISSVIRYFNALSTRFVEVASNVDLIGAEADEVTQIYENILLSAKQGNRAYVGDRLLQFHAFAKAQGVEDPDWNELPLENLSHAVSPGVISEQEYRAALQLLLKSGDITQYSGASLGMLLLLCFRFGLRGKEALGLMRSDWIDYGETVVILVRNNRIRKLKTPSSRRQVPLVFSLDAVEEDLIARHFVHLESQFGNSHDCPLFLVDRQPLSETGMNGMRALVIAVLKIVTRNPGANLHHARHTAANYLALRLFGITLDSWKGSAFSHRPDARQVVLGMQGTTRRAAWATARYLGHSRRDTQFQSYLHFMSDWADSYWSPLALPSASPNPAAVIQLDDLPRMAALETGVLEQLLPSPVATTPQKLVELLRHVAMGKSWEVASRLLQLEPAPTTIMRAVLDEMAGKIRLGPNVGGAGMALLQKIKKNGWNRLIAHLHDMESVKKDSIVPAAEENYTVFMQDTVAMIGSSRQLVMWRECHFTLVRSMLDYYNIPSALYKSVASNQAKPDIFQMGAEAGFRLISQAEAGSSDALQLDAVREPDNGYHVESRCAISFQKNATSFVRSSYELMLLFIVFAVWRGLCKKADSALSIIPKS